MIRKGTYVLAIALGSDHDIEVGALGTLHFDEGVYCYVGSAMNGLDQRVSRHISKDKRVRWHIDRLTMAADSVEAYESYPIHIPECTLARMAEGCGMTPSHRGFGCSDCDCPTHLFMSDEDSIRRLVSAADLSVFRDHRAVGPASSGSVVGLDPKY